MPNGRSLLIAVTLQILSSCTTHSLDEGQAAVRSNTRTVSLARHQVESDLPSSELRPIVEELISREVHPYGFWNIPGQEGVLLVMAEEPPSADGYGPRLLILSTSDLSARWQSGRLFDVTYASPVFFPLGDRTLVLVDHGTEDSYGLLSIMIGDTISSMGLIPVALPPDIDIFTSGAAEQATLTVHGGTLVLHFRGPLILNPQGKDEKLLNCSLIKFVGSSGHFEIESSEN